jgi:hypothetical protein
MRPVKFLAVALGAATLIGGGLSAPSAQAGYIVTLEQVGSNVVANGSGPIDLTGLSFEFSNPGVAEIVPMFANISTGPASGQPIVFYTGFTGPTSFGSGRQTFANSGSGDLVGIVGDTNLLAVPHGYVSGTSLTDSSTYNNQTFATLGVVPGTYEWTWGSVTNQNFTLIISTAVVPEPGSLALLGAGLAGFVFLRRRRQNG